MIYPYESAEGNKASRESLNLIDEFLSDQQSNDLLAKTIQEVKPLYMQMVREQLKNESKRLLEDCF